MSTSTVNDFLFMLAVVSGSLGLFLLYFGWHGKRLDYRPICKKCKFDLHGLLKSSERCPECGVSLRIQQNIQLGQRAPIKGLIAISIAMILFGVVTIAWQGTIMASQMNWLRMAKTSSLIQDLESTNIANETESSRELARRVASNHVSVEEFNSIYTIALARQADASRPWVNSYGDVLELSMLADEASDEERVQILTNAITPTLILMPETTEGELEAMSLGIKSGGVRLGSGGRVALAVELRSFAVDGGEPQTVENPMRATISIFGGSSPSILAQRIPISLEAGDHHIQTTWTIMLVSVEINGESDGNIEDSESRTLATSEFVLENTLSIQ